MTPPSTVEENEGGDPSSMAAASQKQCEIAIPDRSMNASQVSLSMAMTPPLSPAFLEDMRRKRMAIHERRLRSISTTPAMIAGRPIGKLPSSSSSTSTTSPIKAKRMTDGKGNAVMVFVPQTPPSPISLFDNAAQMDESERVPSFNWISSHLDFLALVESCQQAIDRQTSRSPKRVGSGSSGSYFIYADKDDTVVGVFKPKNEEPYAHLNPRWIKWLQKTCCPCFFGRPFMMPTCGYISEAAASLVDAFLGLDMVPRTQIAHFASSSFNYSSWIRMRAWQHGSGVSEDELNGSSNSNNNNNNSHNSMDDEEGARRLYPLKIGSFQLFVNGFEDSQSAMAKMSAMGPLPLQLRIDFQHQIERMAVLDYVIRNTDRTMDNWMVHLSRVEVLDSGDDCVVAMTESSGPSSALVTKQGRTAAKSSVALNRGSSSAWQQMDNNQTMDMATGGQMLKHQQSLAGSENALDCLRLESDHQRYQIKIACIDNGLAFPFKHPDPTDHRWDISYSWSKLPEARIPFSAETRDHLLPLLADPSSWEMLVGRLQPLFMIDSDYSEKMFKRQMAVMRGQIFNLVQSLMNHESPSELISRPPILITGPNDPQLEKLRSVSR